MYKNRSLYLVYLDNSNCSDIINDNKISKFGLKRDVGENIFLREIMKMARKTLKKQS